MHPIKQLALLNLGVIEQPRMKVEIISHIPQSDLDYIIENYSKGTEEHNFETLGRGAYGKVLGYKNYAIKKFHSYTSSSNRDIKVLKDIGHLDCVPNIYACVENPMHDYKIMITERVKGVTIGHYVEKNKANTGNIDRDFVKRFENALLKIVGAGYSPEDIHDYNVMIDLEKKEPIIVDVGLFYKHGIEYKTEEEMRDNRTYKSAMNYTGDSLNKYIKRIRAKYEVREANNKERVQMFGIVGARPIEVKLKKVNWTRHKNMMNEMMKEIDLAQHQSPDAMECAVKFGLDGIRVGDVHMKAPNIEADIIHGAGAGVSFPRLSPIKFRKATSMSLKAVRLLEDGFRFMHRHHFGLDLGHHNPYEPKKPEPPKNLDDVIKMKKDKPHFAKEVVKPKTKAKDNGLFFWKK